MTFQSTTDLMQSKLRTISAVLLGKMSEETVSENNQYDFVLQFANEASKDVLVHWQRYQEGMEYAVAVQGLAEDLLVRRQAILSQAMDVHSFEAMPETSQSYYVRLATYALDSLKS